MKLKPISPQSVHPQGETIITLAKRHDPFARVPKTLLDDPALSWSAKGILAYLIGKPSGWKLRVNDIINHGTDRKHCVRNALNELRDAGYADYVQLRVNGRLAEGVWKVSDSPIFSPRSGFQDAGNQDTENQHHSKKDSTKIHGSKKEKGAFAKHSRNFVPRFAYPVDEQEMIETLTDNRVEYHQDYDGDFFDNMTKSGWMIQGKPVYDWIATYIARVEHNHPDKTAIIQNDDTEGF
jgi:hypothetical protein